MSVVAARRGSRRATATARAAGEVGRLAEIALCASRVIYLGVLWTVACLPLVTIPAASVALLARVRAWRVGGHEPSAREMLRELRTSFARRTATMLVLVAVGAVLALDLRAVALAPAAARPAALTLWFAVTIVVAMLTALTPAVLAADDVGCVAAIRRSARAVVLRPAVAATAVAVLAVAAVVVVSAPVSAPLLAVATAAALDRLSTRTAVSPSPDERTVPS